ncbi:MAG: DNA adenine methylase, partial [bacterium]|nr:DNA adenine methylase [bacterium]
KQAPFTSVLNSAKKGDFAYFDPPYVPLSTTSNFTSYSKDGFAADLQTELRDICQALHEKDVKFMLSNSSAALVYELYKEFKIEEVDARRQVNSVASKRGPVKEVIVRNY